jgi:Pyrimidine dimer DNA glycosylase
MMVKLEDDHLHGMIVIRSTNQKRSAIRSGSGEQRTSGYADKKALLESSTSAEMKNSGSLLLAPMRLWSLHPSLLDPKGLVALWREALLAQKVLQGMTKGYRSHPQLARFQQSRSPLTAILAYLWAVHDEACRRGYSFDASKIARRRQLRTLTVPQGQLDFEVRHLKTKIRLRDPKRYRDLCRLRKIRPHPLFIVVAGEIEPWERP